MYTHIAQIGSPASLKPLLKVEQVQVEFRKPRSLLHLFTQLPTTSLRAVNGVSLTIDALETVGLVGESGSGKTTLGRTILQLYKPNRGFIQYRGRTISDPNPTWQRQLRREIQMVFQDPYSSLNPRMTVSQTLTEVLRFHAVVTERLIGKEVQRLLQLVGLNSSMTDRLPRNLSGGQRQRVGLARALAVRPSLLVLDEPVAALDVSIQAQILNLLDDLKTELGLTMLFIAHDLSVVKHVSDRVAVMYLGQVVEVGTKREIFSNPRHPYTQSLLAAVPKLVPRKKQRQPVLASDTSTPTAVGCPFQERCPLAQDLCAREEPPTVELSTSHQAACHFAD